MRVIRTYKYTRYTCKQKWKYEYCCPNRVEEYRNVPCTPTRIWYSSIPLIECTYVSYVRQEQGYDCYGVYERTFDMLYHVKHSE